MSARLYSIVYVGDILDGFDPEQVKHTLATMFRQTPEKMARLLARADVSLKAGLDEVSALKYHQALTRAGLSVAIRPPLDEAVAKADPAGPGLTLESAPQEAVAAPAAPTDAALPPARATTAAAPGEDEVRIVPFEFGGQGGEYFRIWIVNLFLTILTLGIYSAWAKVRNKRYFYGNTVLDGSSFEYTGNPIAILKGRLIAGGLFLLYAVAGQFAPALSALLFLLLMAAMPWMITRSLMFNARNSVYRNVRFRFQGPVKDAYFVFLLWPLAAMLTFGILSPLAYFKQQLFVVENHAYGTTNFEFHAVAKDYYRMFLVMILGFLGGIAVGMMLMGMVPLLGAVIVMLAYLFVFVYFSVHDFNLRCNNSKIALHGFEADMELPSYARLVAINTVLTMLTLGLYRPWAMVRTANYKAEHLRLEAVGDLGQFIASEEQQINTLGEEMGDMFDFDIGL